MQPAIKSFKATGFLLTEKEVEKIYSHLLNGMSADVRKSFIIDSPDYIYDECNPFEGLNHESIFQLFMVKNFPVFKAYGFMINPQTYDRVYSMGSLNPDGPGIMVDIKKGIHQAHWNGCNCDAEHYSWKQASLFSDQFLNGRPSETISFQQVYRPLPHINRRSTENGRIPKF